MRILLVDDDSSIRLMLAALLKPYGGRKEGLDSVVVSFVVARFRRRLRNRGGMASP
jgi:hypothetical protein